MVFQTSLTAMQAATDRQHVAVATGFRNFSRLLSGTIFIAISSSLINQSITNIGLSAETIQQVLNDPPSIHTSPAFDDNTRNNIIDAYQNGFRTVFYMLTGTGCVRRTSSYFRSVTDFCEDCCCDILTLCQTSLFTTPR